MDFFKSVLLADPEPLDLQKDQRSLEIEEEEKRDPDREDPLEENEQDPSPKSSGGSAWSFGGLIRTFASKSESVLQNYRRDLEEFSSGLKKETAVIREAASRAVKELPLSIDVGASVAQETLESVGQAVDDIGSSVWRGTVEIISHGKGALISADFESDNSDNPQFSNSSLTSKRYSRFEAQVHAIQTDFNTYSDEPEDLDEFNKWKLGFVLEEKDEEIENILRENGVMEEVYTKLVPSAVDRETFWIRYFYRIHKLKQVEDARANLVKKAISGEEEEDLSWDVEDDEDNGEETNVAVLKGDSSETKALEKKCDEEPQVRSSETIDEMGENGSYRENDNKGFVAKFIDENGSEVESNCNEMVAKSEKMFLEGKSDQAESGKDSDFSVVSSQPSSPEEEDLGWDEIEDLSSIDDKKVTVGGSPNKADLRKRLSAADEEEDLSWDVEDDVDPVKP